MRCKRGARGFTVLEMIMVVSIVALVVIISVPAIVGAKKGANEGSAQTSLKTIATQQTIFKESDSDDDDKHQYGNLTQLTDSGVLDSILGSGSKAGYRFEVEASTTTPTELWFATARPIVPTKTGDRYFCTNQTGVIYFTTEGPIPMNNTTCVPPAGVQPME